MKWSSVCAEQAQGVKPGDPIFTAWVRLAATPVRDVKAIVNPRRRDDDRRGRGRGRRQGGGQEAAAAAVPRRPGRRRWRRLPRRPRRPRPRPARPPRGARDPRPRRLVPLLGPHRPRGQRGPAQGPRRRASRRARGQAPGRGRAPRPPRLLTPAPVPLPTSAQFSFVLRVRIDHRPGMLGRVATAIGEAGGTIGSIDLVAIDDVHTLRDMTVDAAGTDHAQADRRRGRRRSTAPRWSTPPTARS